MKNKRRFLFPSAAILIILLIAGTMFIIGRGHTVYFDNKVCEYNGKTFECPYKIVVTVDGEQVAKLYERERGSTTNIGQSFSMSLRITDVKGGDERSVKVSLKLPYNMDGIVINLPALLAGQPAEAYISEFVPVATEADTADEEVVTDEFGLETLEDDTTADAQ